MTGQYLKTQKCVKVIKFLNNQVHLRPLVVKNESEREYFSKRMASLTPGFSGADIMNVCNEAAIQAVRNEHKHIERNDFEMAIERVIGGLEKKKLMNEEEEKVVAVHESGHGVVAWYLPGAMPLLKLTIIPRSKGALGFAQYLPSEQSLDTKDELLDRLVSVLGGRVAEEEFFGRVTTGAYDDLQKAYRIAHSMVTKLGMDQRLGYVSLEEGNYSIKPYSDKTNQEIDEQCREIISQATARCRELVIEHKEEIRKMSDKLIEKKTIDLKDITEVLGPRPFEPKENFKAYLEATFE